MNNNQYGVNFSNAWEWKKFPDSPLFYLVLHFICLYPCAHNKISKNTIVHVHLISFKSHLELLFPVMGQEQCTMVTK